MIETDETMYDYLARLNMEGKRAVWIQNRFKIDYVYRKIRKYIRHARTACEVGVGEGYLLRLLHQNGLKVLGIDISKHLVNELNNKFDREGLDIELIHADISKVKLEKGMFDLFFCIYVLEHIPNVEEAIKNIKNALSYGRGLLIETLPFQENLSRNMVICPKCHHKFHRIGRALN